MADDAAGSISIRRWSGIARRDELVPAIDAVFFEASATKSFAGEGDRAAFRERWLGRYLANYPEWAYVAFASGGVVVGYLAGSLDDPARTPLFSDLGYFAAFAALTATYPAQLHVNLDPGWRGRGIGSRLVETFAADAREAGAPGVHAVTSRGMCNARFYEACGFREAGAALWNGRELVFLARSLALA